MKNKTVLSIILIIIVLILAWYFGINNSKEPTLANPASAYCVDQGGRLEIITSSDGSQSGFCIFSDGSECEEWAFYRKECATGNFYPVDQLSEEQLKVLDDATTDTTTKYEDLLLPDGTNMKKWGEENDPNWEPVFE